MNDLKTHLKRHTVEEYKEKCKHVNKAVSCSVKGNIEKLSHVELLKEDVSAKENLSVLFKTAFPYVVNHIKIKQIINKWVDYKMSDYNASLKNAEDRRRQLSKERLSELQSKKESLQKFYDEKIIEYKDKLNDLYQPIYNVQQNKTAIEQFAESFNIDLNLYSIDYHKMSLNEIKEISILANEALKDTIQGQKGFSSLLKLLYLPLLWQPFEDKLYDLIFKCFYLFLLSIIIYVTNPYGVGLVSLLVIVQALGNTALVIKNCKLISVAYTLNMVFESFDERITTLLAEESSLKEIETKYNELCAVDVNELLKQELKEADKDIEEIVKASPYAALKETADSNEIKEYINSLIESMESIRSEYIQEFNKNLEGYKNYVERIKKEIDKRASEAAGPGIPVSSDYFMDFSFKSSAVTAKDGRIIGYDKTELPFKNILFQYSNETERIERINNIKLMLSSMLGNIRENFLEITIVDTEQLGRSFTEFLDKKIRNNVRLVTQEWNKEFLSIVNSAKENMLTVGTKNFNEFNKLNAAEGKTTLVYKLIIILSTDKPLWGDKLFEEFKQYSTDMGVWIWLVHGKANLYKKDKRLPDGIISLLKFPIIIQNNNFYLYNSKEVSLYLTDEFTLPLTYSLDIGKKSIANFIKTVDEGRMDIVDYENEYRLRHIPDDKIWSYSTLDGIALHFGFLDGDRSNPNIEWLGSDGVKPVHCLMAGETGAGKSATINQVLANLLYMYPPEELELIMIDFKNVEFNMYTGDLLIPHAKLIAGTTDGEYGLSIFEFILKEMRRRQSLFAKYKFQNIMDWNNAVLNGQINEKYMPRILVLADEFQVMFTEVEAKIVEQIKITITSASKLARFAGLHLWFTSQSMKGTMSQDILDQFALRAALRSSYDTSIDILGNDAAFKKLRGRGFIYTNCAKGDLNENHRYTIPFASNKYIKTYIPKLINKCRLENHIHRNADFYNEKKKHKLKEMDKWIKNPAIQESKALILGEKTYFSTNVLPVNFILGQEDGENIIIAGQNRDDRYNLVNTLLNQLEFYGYNVVASCPDTELSALLKLKERISETYHTFLNDNKPEKILDLAERLIEARSTDGKKQHKPIFILNLMWDKMVGLGIGESYSIVDRYKEIVQKSADYNIHIVLTVRFIKPFSFVLPFFNHKICAQADEDTSIKLLDNSKAVKLSQDDDISRMAIYIRGIKEEKFKIYMSDMDKSKIRKETAVFMQS